MKIAADPRAEYRHQHRVADAYATDAIYRSVAEDYVAEFNRLVAEWRRATAALSFTDQKKAHPALRRIVAMRDLALPLILRELRQRPDFLFLALPDITGEDPGAGAKAGGPRAMVDAWLRWAERNGHAD